MILSLTVIRESSTVKRNFVALEPKNSLITFSLSQQRIERHRVVRKVRLLSPNGAV